MFLKILKAFKYATLYVTEGNIRTFFFANSLDFDKVASLLYAISSQKLKKNTKKFVIQRLEK